MNDELIGIISNEGELRGVIEDDGLNVNVTIVGAGEQGKKGERGIGLQYEWAGTKLGIKTEAESDFEYVDLVASTTYTHHQISASREWLVRHNLGKHPSVTVVDSASTVVVGDVEYLDTEGLIIRFTSEFSGKAFLN